jgi:hypothetical protein
MDLINKVIREFVSCSFDVSYALDVLCGSNYVFARKIRTRPEDINRGYTRLLHKQPAICLPKHTAILTSPITTLFIIVIIPH